MPGRGAGARHAFVTVAATTGFCMTDLAALTPERLHARFARKISRHVRAVMGHDDEREDLVQEVFVAVLRRIDTLRDPACLDGWVNQVTTNTLKYMMRRRRLRRHASWDALPEPNLPSWQDNPYARVVAMRAMRVMDSLPPNDRVLLTTYWFSPATARSIAAEAGCSIISVRRRIQKAQTRFEKIARRDPELARCIEDARVCSRRWRLVPASLSSLPRSALPDASNGGPSPEGC